MKPSLPILLNILSTKGDQQYGLEVVSQLEHALQCAALAEAAPSSAELVTACLLHDLGHLIHDLGEDAASRGVDDRHEYRAIPFLRELFGLAVTEPIRLHVEAKRYLCAVDPAYWQSLSSASKCTLELQGGIFASIEAERFINQPYAKDAVQLRIWDDHAKIPGFQIPDLEHFIPIMKSCL